MDQPSIIVQSVIALGIQKALSVNIVRWQKSKGPGRIKWKLSELIQAEGFGMSPFDLHKAKGYWRIRGMEEDCPKWSGYGTMPDGLLAIFDSYDTMSECVRFGITITHDYRDAYGVYDVSANRP